MHAESRGLTRGRSIGGCLSTAFRGILYVITEPVHDGSTRESHVEPKPVCNDVTGPLRFVRTESTATTQAGDAFRSTDSDIYCISDGMRQAVMAACACNMKCC